MDVMLSDNMKRLICRAVFILLCIIPTFFSIKTILLPRSNQDWASQLRQQFGVRAEIGSVTQHSPQVTQFDNLLFGPAGFLTRLNVEQASLQTLPQGRRLIVEQASGSPAALWSTLNKIAETIQWEAQNDIPLDVHFRKVSLRENDSAGAQAFDCLDLVIEIDRRGKRIVSEFVIDKERPENRFTIKRNIDHQGQTTWTLDGAGGEIPAWILSPIVPQLAPLNETSTLVNAYATMTKSSTGWSGEFNGTIQNIDIRNLIGERFGAKLNGKALLKINSAEVRNSRIYLMDGDAFSPSGQVGARFLQACKSALGMELVEPYGASDESYSNFRFGFRLRNHKIAFLNMKDSMSILNDQQGNRILIARHGQNIPLSAILKLLTWPTDGFNQHAANLSRHLNLPAISSEHLNWQMEQMATQPEIGDGSYLR